jgi:hypothetical protein
MLENSEIEYLNSYKAFIGGYVVWIENLPYASGSLETKGLHSESTLLSCSRKTALFLNDSLESVRLVQELRDPHNRHEVYEKTGFYL